MDNLVEYLSSILNCLKQAYSLNLTCTQVEQAFYERMCVQLSVIEREDYFKWLLSLIILLNNSQQQQQYYVSNLIDKFQPNTPFDYQYLNLTVENQLRRK